MAMNFKVKYKGNATRSGILGKEVTKYEKPPLKETIKKIIKKTTPTIKKAYTKIKKYLKEQKNKPHPLRITTTELQQNPQPTQQQPPTDNIYFQRINQTDNIYFKTDTNPERYTTPGDIKKFI